MPSPGRMPLLDLMRDRTGTARPPGERAAIEQDAREFEEFESRSFLAPGRVVRVPIGYLLVGVAAFLAVGVGAYSIGHEMGEQRLRDRFAQMQAAGGSAPVASQDPLMSPGRSDSDDGALGVADEGGDGRNSNATSGSEENATASDSGGRPSGDGDGDPRAPGMNYHIVAYYPPEEAERAAAFLRENGVEAGVFPTNSERFRYVVSLKGFEAGTLGSAEARRHEALLRQLGRRWKRDHNGPTNFSDMWAMKYEPE